MHQMQRQSWILICSIFLQCIQKKTYKSLMTAAIEYWKSNFNKHNYFHWTIYYKEFDYWYTVETRNFEVAWFDIPVTSISFWSPELFCYIINVNKIACLDIQSLDISSHSMSIHGPNTTFHMLRLTHGSKSISRLLSQRCEKQRVSFNNKCLI